MKTKKKSKKKSKKKAKPLKGWALVRPDGRLWEEFYTSRKGAQAFNSDDDRIVRAELREI